jgi:hypothetical protein
MVPAAPPLEVRGGSLSRCAGRRPYVPRRPERSPLYRVLADHFAMLERVHEERFEPTHGPLRAAARRTVGRFLDCGLLEHGFARVRCGTGRAEFRVAFRCKGRQFCPSCRARRLWEWSLWLEEHLLAPVAHRQVVLTVPKRLRPYFLHDRRRLGLLSRLATWTLRAYVQAGGARGGARVCSVRADVRLGGARASPSARADDRRCVPARRHVHEAARTRGGGAGGAVAARGARGVRAAGVVGGGGGGGDARLAALGLRGVLGAGDP